MATEKKGPEKATEKSPAVTQKAENPAPKVEPKQAPITGDQEIAILKDRLLALLRENTEVVQTKDAEKIAALRTELRSRGAVDIP